MKNSLLKRKHYLFNWLMMMLIMLLSPLVMADPSLSKVFTPNVIGPGSVSTITFSITNSDNSPVTDLAFTDVLPLAPGAMTIASPANASTSCSEGILSAPDGGGTISLSSAKLGASQSCTITVDIIASTPGLHTNPAITLTFAELAGDPPTSLTADLTVVTTLPGFSKSFAPSSVSLGGRSTLTFTIDNSVNTSKIGSLDFTDNLPTGMVIADPAKASTDCISPTLLDTTLTAIPGTSS